MVCKRLAMVNKAAILVVLLSPAAFGQDAKAVVDSAAKAMGAVNLGSVRYSGSGLNFALGQAVTPVAQIQFEDI
jgi:hypothetical protein